MPVLTLEEFKEKAIQMRIDHIHKILPYMEDLHTSFLEDNDFEKLAKVKKIIDKYDEELDEADHGYERWIAYHRKTGIFQGRDD